MLLCCDSYTKWGAVRRGLIFQIFDYCISSFGDGVAKDGGEEAAGTHRVILIPYRQGKFTSFVPRISL